MVDISINLKSICRLSSYNHPSLECLCVRSKCRCSTPLSCGFTPVWWIIAHNTPTLTDRIFRLHLFYVHSSLINFMIYWREKQAYDLKVWGSEQAHARIPSKIIECLYLTPSSSHTNITIFNISWPLYRHYHEILLDCMCCHQIQKKKNCVL